MLVVVLALSAGAPLAALAADDAAPDFFPLAEVERGLTGYGLSVFAGTEPERFEVEVIGVWKNVSPDVSYILAKLTGHGLESSGVVAGMSGSPVFFDGRPAGAVAFSWSFTNEAIAGITPIETMRELLAVDARGSAAALAPPPATVEQIAKGELGEEWLARQFEVLAPRRIGQAAMSVGWAASGLGERTRALLERPLSGLAAAGSADAVDGDGDGDGDGLGPGASVAAVLVDGDLRLAATGTVTDRVGESLLAFGHPMFGFGALAVPMATSEVVTVISSQFNSFKIANIGAIGGAFSLDHAAGIRGEVGAEAPMIPVRVSVASILGEARESIDVRVADLPAVTPSLVAISVLGALDTATEAVGSHGIDLVARYDLGDAGTLEMEQSFDGSGSEISAAIHLLSVTGYLLQNALEEVRISSLDLELTRHGEPRTARLVGAHAAKTEVEPGETLTLNLDLSEYRGGKRRMQIDVPLPAALADGTYSLLVGDGVSIDAARLAIERIAPVTFPQALEFLDSLHSRRDLVVMGVLPSRGVSVAGEAMPRLPGSVRSLWSAAGSGSAVPLELARVQEQTQRMDNPVEGAFRVDVRVRRPTAASPNN